MAYGNVLVVWGFALCGCSFCRIIRRFIPFKSYVSFDPCKPDVKSRSSGLEELFMGTNGEAVVRIWVLKLL